jgi:hypothetical protein
VKARSSRVTAVASALLAAAVWTVVFGEISMRHVPRLVAANSAYLRYPFERNSLEGTIVYGVGRLRDSGDLAAIYPGDAAYRRRPVAVHYMPLFHVTAALWGRLVGVSIGTVRFLVVMYVAGLAVAAAAFVRRATGSLALGAAMAAALLASHAIVGWMGQARVDALAWFLVVLGGYVLIRLDAARRWSAWSAAVFALAFLTKQNMVAAPAAACLTLVVTDRPAWRFPGGFSVVRALSIVGRRLARPLVYGLVYLGLIAAGFLVMHVASDGRWWVYTLGFYRHVGWSWATARHYVLNVFGVAYARQTLFALPAFLWLVWVAAGKRSPAAVFTVVWLVVQAPLSLYELGTAGVDHNYLVPFVIPMYLAIALAVGDLISRSLPWRVAGYGFVLAFVLAAPPSSPTTWSRIEPRVEFIGGTKYRISELVEAAEGDVLVEELTYAMKAGKPVFIDPLNAVFMQSGGYLRLEETEVAAKLAAGEIELIVLAQHWHPGLVEAVLGGSDVVYSEGSYTVYKPSGRFVTSARARKLARDLYVLDRLRRAGRARLDLPLDERRHWLSAPDRASPAWRSFRQGMSVGTAYRRERQHLAWDFDLPPADIRADFELYDGEARISNAAEHLGVEVAPSAEGRPATVEFVASVPETPDDRDRAFLIRSVRVDFEAPDLSPEAADACEARLAGELRSEIRQELRAEGAEAFISRLDRAARMGRLELERMAADGLHHHPGVVWWQLVTYLVEADRVLGSEAQAAETRDLWRRVMPRERLDSLADAARYYARRAAGDDPPAEGQP